MKKRIVSILMCVCMALTMMPAATITANAEDPAFTGGMTAMMNPAGTGDVWIFANSTSITIEAKGSGTVIKGDNSGVSAEVDLAEVTKSLMNGETSAALTNNGENGYDLIKTVIFGGKNQAGELVADTSITLNGGTVGALVGGNYKYAVTGNTNITINGGTLKGANLKYDSTKNNLYTYFTGGCLGDYGYVVYDSSAPSDVSGEANVTINGGSFETQFPYYTFGYAGGCSYSSYNSVCSANLFIHGGSFANYTSFYSSSYCAFTAATAYADNTGKTPGLYIYCSVSGLSGKIRTEDYNLGNNHSSYILTCDEGAFPSSADKSRMMVIDAANKTYRFGSGVTEACLFADYTIPAGYKLEIPAGVTLTIPNHTTITNNGSIVIKGTLTNKGAISGSGSIVRVGEAVYTGGTPAAEAVPSVVAGFTTLTFEPGATRGTTKLTAIDAAESGNTQYFKYVYSTSGEPTPPTGGDILTSTEGYSAIPVPDTEITVAKNGGYMIAIEVDGDNKYVKYSCAEMTDDTICGEADYDALETSIVTGGDGENTTRITAEADSGNSLYYGITDSEVGANFAFNTPIDVSGLTAVQSGTDIPTALGKYLSVYSVYTIGSDTKPLCKFLCLPLTENYFTGFTGGLIADTTNKIIYCNGRTVCMSVDSFNFIVGYSTISIPKLYVLENGQWRQAVPKNLPFSEGFGFSEYTFSGKAGADDNTGKKGTLYLLSSNMEYNYTHFYWALPRGAADFENFIVPDIAGRPGTDINWIPRYTVGGTINPLDSKQEHLERKYKYYGGPEVFRIFEMARLTLEAGAKLIVPTSADDGSISDDPRIYFHGDAADDIVKGNGASIQNAVHMAYTPKAAFKLLKADGTEFSKNENGKYLVQKNTQVTIVASLGVYDTAASVAALPAVCTSAPGNDTSSDATPGVLGTYVVGFRGEGGMYWEFYYYDQDDLSISYSGGSDERRITTLALTLPNINAYGDKELFVATRNIMTELWGESCVPPQLVDSCHSLQFTLTKQNQASITASMPASTTYGTDGLAVGASGGSGTGIFSYSSNTNAATVDASGNIAVVGAGNTSISVTKAGDDDYEPRTDTFNLTVNKKTPVGADLTLTPASNLVYNGSPKAAAVTAEEGITGLGSVTAVYYEGKAGTAYAKSTTAPVNAGSYMVSVDLSSGNNYTAASGLAAGEFAITKDTSWPAPTNGSMDDTANMFTFTPVSGYTDYQVSTDDGATWADCIDIDSDSNTITINVGNIAGAISVRIKETDNYAGASLASGSFNASLEGSVAVSGTAKYGQTITANVTGAQSNAVFNYVWKAGGTQIAQTDVNTLALTTNGLIGKTITVEVTAAPYAGTLTGGETAPVAKGDPAGSPSYTAITAGGKTLADAALAIGAIQPGTAGYTLNWVDDQGAVLEGTTEVTANTAYRWLFTPEDTANYNTLSGSITLYGVSTGGSGGSGSSSNGSASSGESSAKVSVNVSGKTATVSATDEQIKAITSGADAAGTFKIDVSGLKVDSVVVPSKVVSAAGGASGSAGLSVALPAGTVTLDKAARAAVSGKGDVKLSVETVDNEKLTDTQKEVLGTQAGSAVVVDVNVYVNGIKTSTFGDGKLSISVPYTLKPGESADSITVWFIKDDGTVEPKNGVYNAATGCVEFTTDHLSQYLIVKFPFADVAENSWYYDSVAYACNNGLFSGTSEASFSPGTAMTRQMIWMVLARMDGKSPANMTEAKAWAVENKISDDSNPKNKITRGQMAAILYRYAQYKGYDTAQGGMAIREFADYDSIPAYGLDALGWTVNTGLIQGSDSKLMPQGSATRAQVAAILQRFNQNAAK